MLGQTTKVLATIVALAATGCGRDVTSGSALASDASGATLEQTVNDIAKPYLRYAPGVAIGVIKNGKRYYFGYGDRGDGQAPNERTLFEIGSLTKTMIGEALAQQILERKVSLDDDIATLLPDHALPSFKGQPIRLRHLATHTSSLPREEKGFIGQDVDIWRSRPAMTMTQFWSYLSKFQLRAAPGTNAAYSNLGAALLGHALAARDGTTWDQMLSRRIFTRYGMTDTTFKPTEEQLVRKAQGHGPLGRAIDKRYNGLMDSMGPAGGIQSTLTDLLSFASAHLAQQPNSSAITLSHTKQDNARKGFDARALFWFLTENEGRTKAIYHSGATDGFNSFAYLEPESGIAVVVLANKYVTSLTASPVEKLARQIAEGVR